jgi:hypothetical protein
MNTRGKTIRRIAWFNRAFSLENGVAPVVFGVNKMDGYA